MQEEKGSLLMHASQTVIGKMGFKDLPSTLHAQMMRCWLHTGRSAPFTIRARCSTASSGQLPPTTGT